MKRALVVYNASTSLKGLTPALVDAGYEISMISIDADVPAVLNSESYDLLVIDVDDVRTDFIHFLFLIRKTSGYLFTPIILLSEKPKRQWQGDDLVAGYVDYLRKPFLPEQFHAALTMTKMTGGDRVTPPVENR